ncbi:GDP-mannose 4,6-dehydratase [Arthrobacter sp. 1P04PC]|uniref:GDP-mannose 4,6-dehydratase n=1 Tax=unclassified Arthrobacter TaxID=235627 RepID=UPI0039A06698
MTLESSRGGSGHPQRALVTGISGQDGSYLAEQLVEAGWDVHGMVRAEDANPRQHEAGGVTLHEGDLSDPSRLAELIGDLAPDTIFNLGGISSVAASWERPYETVVSTGAAAVAMLEAAWQLQNRTGREIRFLQASSAEIFGQAKEVPQNEGTPLRPITPYGAAKALAHHAVGTYRARGLFASSAVLYNHESLRRPSSFVTRRITLGVAAIALGLKERLSLGNLDAVRDFGWAPDYVDAMVRIASAEQPEDFVVATGVSRSVRDFAEAAFLAAGVSEGLSLIDVNPKFRRPVDAPEMRGDATKISDTLGWRATATFEDIVAAMVQHDLGVVREHGLSSLPGD